MKLRTLILMLVVGSFASAQAQRYMGGDISMYTKYKEAGSKYYDTNGTAITDLYAYFKEQGMNMMRVRLFVAPTKATSDERAWGAIQDLDYVKKLGKEIKDNGLKLLVDFHYSDTWADPTNQWTPDSWKSMTDEQLIQQMYDYTKSCLQTLKDYGAQPDAIQIGNEISYGLLWGPVGTSTANQKKALSGNTANWQRLADMLNNASKACREVCPQAKVVLHTELIRNYSLLTNFYTQMSNYSVDYDIIGLSYYAPYHGTLPSQFRSAVRWCKNNFSNKEVWIVEFAYPAQWALPGTNAYDLSATYPYTDAGQAKFVSAAIAEMNSWDNVTGLFWWWPEANEYGKSTQITSSWWNGTLFNNQNGRAFSAITHLKEFNPTATGIDQINATTTTEETTEKGSTYTLDGRQVNGQLQKGIYIRGGKKFVVK